MTRTHQLLLAQQTEDRVTCPTEANCAICELVLETAQLLFARAEAKRNQQPY